MDEARLTLLIERLWDKQPDQVYAILDGARDPQVYTSVMNTGLPTRCLFSGTLGKELAQAAPYLVQLKQRHESTRHLLDLGWGKSWGIFCASPGSIEDLRRHFRRFLRVQDPKGKTLYFRYYDPRVLRVYLPTCNEGELATIFGPVARFLVEGADPAQLLVYRRAGANLDLGLVDWGGPTTPAPA